MSADLAFVLGVAVAAVVGYLCWPPSDRNDWKNHK